MELPPYGIDPPVGSGPVWGWLVCGVLFVLMGGIPLAVALPAMFRRYRQDEPGSMSTPRSLAGLTPEVIRTAAGAFSAMRSLRRSGLLEQAVADAVTHDPQASAADSDDLVSRLERLDVLHRSGALDDAQYEAAKSALLGRERQP
jgi:hypothetical protein